MKQRSRILAGAALLVVACGAYYPALHGGFVLDDDLLLTKNNLVQAPDGLARIWFSTEPTDYWPLANSTLWFEWRLWGDNSTGYHCTNLALHLVATLLIWGVLTKLSIPGAFLAALLFAVHPVNVESVAWIAQRKGLLAMVFLLLSILWYLKSDERRETKLWYWLSLSSFTLAMLSKGSVAVGPVVLLLIVWWLQRRIGAADIVRTLPFFLVAIVLTAVNMWFQTHGTEIVFRHATSAQRLMGAGAAIWFYLSKALLPLDLIFIYPLWEVHTNGLWLLPLLVTLAVTAILLWRLKSPHANWSRSLLFAWAFLCIALVPVMGFTDVGFMRYSLVADHYQYIALVGVAAAVGAAWSAWHGRQRAAPGASTTAAIVICALAALTWQQSRLYADAITLYQATLVRNPQCWLIENNLGGALVSEGRLPEAIEHYHRALALQANYPEARNNLGLALEMSGDTEKAIKEFKKALRLKKNYAEARFDLANALIQDGRSLQGIDEYQRAIKLNPDYVEAYYNLGLALDATGKTELAIENYRRALTLKPNYAEAHNNLGNALFNSGQLPAAIEQYQKAIEIKPDFAEAHNNLATALTSSGRLQDAIAQYQEALRLKPEYASAHTNLANVLTQSGQLPEAIEHYQQTLRLDAERADAWFGLANAYAKMNRSDDATAAAQKALELARAKGQTDLSHQIESWLKTTAIQPSR